MNIALIGAPGSGKTELAHALVNKVGPSPVGMVDGYVQELEARAQIALGPIADYLGNLSVALERYQQERVARLKYETVITCGTVIETAVYMSMHLSAVVEGLDEAEKEASVPRIDVLLRIMALLYQDVFKYDKAFFLPAREVTTETEYLDRQLQAGLVGFKLMPVTLLTDPETQLADALEVIGEVPASE